MKFLLIMWIVLYLLSFLFATVRVNGVIKEGICLERILGSLIGSFILTLLLGLPILGIVSLL